MSRNDDGTASRSSTFRYRTLKTHEQLTDGKLYVRTMELRQERVSIINMTRPFAAVATSAAASSSVTIITVVQHLLNINVGIDENSNVGRWMIIVMSTFLLYVILRSKRQGYRQYIITAKLPSSVFTKSPSCCLS